MIIITNHIQELSKFEVAKLNLLTPQIQQFKNTAYQTNLLDLYINIDHFVQVLLKDFLSSQLDYFINATEFYSSIYEAYLFLDTKQFQDIDKRKYLFNIDNFQSFFLDFEVQFHQFQLNLSTFKQNFMKSIYKEKQVQQMKVIQEKNIISIIEYNCQGQYIKEIINKLQKNEKFFKRFELYNSKLESLEDLQQNFIDCNFSIIILKYLKLFYNIQCQYLQSINLQIQNYTVKKDQQQEKGYKERVASVLILQKQKINSLLSLTDDQSIKVNCKSLLAQIENDFILIKSENDKIQNQNINKELLKLLTDANLESIKLLIKLKTSLKYKIYQRITMKIQKKLTTIQNLQLKMFKQIKIWMIKLQTFMLSFQKLDLIFQQYPIFNEIETTEKQGQVLEKVEYYKSQDYENQSQEQMKQNIKEIKDRRDNYFSEKLKSQINTNILKYEFEKKQQTVMNLQLIQFLQFFYQLFFNSQYENVYTDDINNSIWQDIKNAYKDIKETLFNLIKFKPDQKVREGLVYNLIRLQYGVQEQQITSFSGKFIAYIWVFEKAQKVRNLLKNKELIEFQKQLFSKTLDNLSGIIKDQIKERMQILEQLQQQIKLEGNQQKREQYQMLLKKTYDEIDESIDNISEMSEAMNISLVFLKDISKDVKQIKVQIDQLQENIDQLGEDIKLRGKNYKELLEMRQQKILAQSKLANVDSVYVQLNTIEYDPTTGHKILYEDKERTLLLVE